MENQKETSDEQKTSISRQEALRKMGKYAAVTAIGTFIVLNPLQSQAMSTPPGSPPCSPRHSCGGATTPGNSPDIPPGLSNNPGNGNGPPLNPNNPSGRLGNTPSQEGRSIWGNKASSNERRGIWNNDRSGRDDR